MGVCERRREARGGEVGRKEGNKEAENGGGQARAGRREVERGGGEREREGARGQVRGKVGERE
eukprot:4092172-Pleurochrysis_carterae.AAC.4